MTTTLTDDAAPEIVIVPAAAALFVHGCLLFYPALKDARTTPRATSAAASPIHSTFTFSGFAHIRKLQKLSPAMSGSGNVFLASSSVSAATMAESNVSQPLRLSHLVRLLQPSIELRRHHSALAQEFEVRHYAVAADDTAIHDRSETTIPIVHLPLLEEKVLHGVHPFGILRLPLDLLPECNTISVLRRLHELEPFYGIIGRGAACLHPARMEEFF